MNYKKMIKTGLTARDCYVLEKLNQGDQTPKEIAEDVMSTANLTLIGDKLLKKKLIKRSHSKDDRRKVILAITPAGKEAIA